MTQRNSSQHDQERDRAVDRYIQALDQGDLETIAVMLEQASHDPELDRLIHETNDAFYIEAGLDMLTTDAEQVRLLARQHLQSAFVDETAIEAASERPLTVGEVVDRLHADRQLSATDLDTSRALRGSRLEVPDELTTQTVGDLAKRIGMTASERFWRAFRETAIMLGLNRSQTQAHLAAAREQRAHYSTQRSTTAQQEDAQHDEGTDERDSCE